MLCFWCISDHIKLVLEEIEKHIGDFDGDEQLKLLLKNAAEVNKLSFSKLMMSLRTALSGLKVCTFDIKSQKCSTNLLIHVN